MNLFDYDDNDPLEIVETLAESHNWEFNRIGDDHVAIVIEGLWRHYFMSLSKSNFNDGMIKLVCTFELTSSKDKYRPQLFELLNLINQEIWLGSFSYSQDKELAVFRYGIGYTDLLCATYDQIGDLLDKTFEYCERYYPALQMVYTGKLDVKEAMELTVGHMSGQA